MTCPLCGGKLANKRISYMLFGENLGIFPAEVCLKCNEQFFKQNVSLAIEKIAKQKKLWDLKSTTKLTKVGNSFSIRIGKNIIDFLKLKQGEEVTIYPENKNKIIIIRKILEK